MEQRKKTERNSKRIKRRRKTSREREALLPLSGDQELRLEKGKWHRKGAGSSFVTHCETVDDKPDIEFARMTIKAD